MDEQHACYAIDCIVNWHLIKNHGSYYSLSCPSTAAGPISYGRTVERHIADPQALGSAQFLSFAQGSLVQVFAKEVAGEEEEYWEAEVGGACTAPEGQGHSCPISLTGQRPPWSCPPGQHCRAARRVPVTSAYPGGPTGAGTAAQRQTGRLPSLGGRAARTGGDRGRWRTA